MNYREYEHLKKIAWKEAKTLQEYDEAIKKIIEQLEL